MDSLGIQDAFDPYYAGKKQDTDEASANAGAAPRRVVSRFSESDRGRLLAIRERLAGVVESRREASA